MTDEADEIQAILDTARNDGYASGLADGQAQATQLEVDIKIVTMGAAALTGLSNQVSNADAVTALTTCAQQLTDVATTLEATVVQPAGDSEAPA